MVGLVGRLATGICHLRYERVAQGPTEPHSGRGTFLLSSGDGGDRYYSVAADTGRAATAKQFLCQMLVARQVVGHGAGGGPSKAVRGGLRCR